MKEIESYIIEFLCGNYSDLVIYGDENSNGKVNIIKDENFYLNYGKKESLPSLPLKELRGIPILFGDARIELREGKAYIYADLIASTYVMISRYEEMVEHDKKDGWGRFPGRESLAFRGGFIDRPLVDEYRILVENVLREVGVEIKERKEEISKVYLTHDIDQPWEQRNLKGFFVKLVYGIQQKHKINFNSLKDYLGIKTKEYLEPFSFFIEQDQKIKSLYTDKCENIYFVLANTEKQWLTDSYIKDERFLCIINILKEAGCDLELHASPLTNKAMEKLKDEKDMLEEYLGNPVKKVRNHCLLVRSPLDMESLIEIGITEDFSCGYADIAGFRLGTSRAVKYINPYNKKLTDLLLHPLIIMDGTLNDERYMNLSQEQALEYIKRLLYVIKRTNGELNILWHNHTCAKNNEYHRNLYKAVIILIQELGRYE